MDEWKINVGEDASESGKWQVRCWWLSVNVIELVRIG